MDRNVTSRMTAVPEPLTAEQRETLRVALEMGYFAVPRAATLVEVADELGRSDVTVSQQLRQATAAVFRTTPGVGVPAPATEDHVDQMLDVLRHPIRRRILRLVRDQNPRTISEFDADAVAATDLTHDRFRLKLLHNHLPKLANAGYIEWDRTNDTVRRGPNFEDVAPLLQWLAPLEDDSYPGSP